MMKAISLWQPWASFVCAGLKQFETRSYPPPESLIGCRLAIHAAKRPVDAGAVAWATRHEIKQLPLGSMVCTVLLTGAYQVSQGLKFGKAVSGSELDIDIPTEEREFGDFNIGRWAWRLADIERFNPPIPAKGFQRFWNWEPPGPNYIPEPDFMIDPSTGYVAICRVCRIKFNDKKLMINAEASYQQHWKQEHAR